MVIERKIAKVREKLISHQIYGNIHTLEDLRIFMSSHVFAVWDFMSLAKRLQISMTCVTLPWIPPVAPQAARLINEIIFYEETDIDYNGAPCSHLEMYLSAMRQIGADTSCFDTFIAGLDQGLDVTESLNYAHVPQYIANFVTHNISCAMHGQVEEVASSFLFGREDAIPEMFSLFLDKWGVDRTKVPALVYYLKRHIDLDGDEHGPAAHKILTNLIGDDTLKEERARLAAIAAIKGRISLWDGINREIHAQREKQKLYKESAIF